MADGSGRMHLCTGLLRAGVRGVLGFCLEHCTMEPQGSLADHGRNEGAGCMHLCAGVLCAGVRGVQTDWAYLLLRRLRDDHVTVTVGTAP